MKNKVKIPLTIAILSILAYSNQGISSLPSQCIYYLTRENWGLSASMIGLIGWIVGLAWYIKVIWGYLADRINNPRKSLTICYSLMLITYIFIIIFGFNLLSLIIIGLLVNIFIGFADTTVDKQMVIAEQKYNLKGRLQAIQWTSLGVAGLIVAIGGAWIAKHFPEHVNYKVAYGLTGIIPLIMLYYLRKKYKKFKNEKIKKISLKQQLKKLKNKKLIMGLTFIACLNFCPSFGTALMIKARETLLIDKMFLGYLSAMVTVLGIIGYLLYYKWAYKFPMKKLLYFMVLFTTITNLFYLYIPNKWFLVTYNIAFGAFGGITFMTLLAFFVKIIPSGSEGLFYALVTSINNFCARGGSFFGGVIYDKFGYNTNVLISSGLTLLCLWFIPRLQIKEE
jgi:MFS family permease